MSLFALYLRAKFCPACGEPKPAIESKGKHRVRTRYRCGDCGAVFVIEEKETVTRNRIEQVGLAARAKARSA